MRHKKQNLFLKFLSHRLVIAVAFELALMGTVPGCSGAQDLEIEKEGVSLNALSSAATTLSPMNATTLCVEPINGSMRNGALVYVVTCDKTSVQQWAINDSLGNIQVGGRMCLDVQDGTDRVGTPIQIWQCFQDNTNQKFDISDGKIRWRNSDKCLTLRGGAVSGAKLQLANCSDTASTQIWNVTDGKNGGNGNDASAPMPTTEPMPTPSTSAPSETIARDQSGTGWGGADLLDPKSTSTYRAPSLDGLLAMPNSLVAKEIGPQADIVAAIRRVTSETGVPSGLLAAMIVQESNGDRNTMSNNPGYGNQPADQRKDVGIIQSPLWKFPGATTAEKLQNGRDPYQNLRIFADEASGVYMKTKSWGQVAQVWYTGYTADRLGGVTGGSSSERNYVLNVFSHLAMGGSTYYPSGGY